MNSNALQTAALYKAVAWISRDDEHLDVLEQ